MKPLLITAITVGLGLAFSAQAQQVQVKVDIKKILITAQSTPSFVSAGAKEKDVPNPRQWLEAEVEFELDSAPKGEIVPSLDFRYYVAVRGKDGAAKYLTGDVKHINLVPGRKELYSSAYVSPATIGKITGDFEKVNASDVLVAVEVTYAGRIVAESSSGGPEGWWRGQATEAGVLSKTKTPFALLWIDRYPDIEDAR